MDCHKTKQFLNSFMAGIYDKNGFFCWTGWAKFLWGRPCPCGIDFEDTRIVKWKFEIVECRWNFCEFNRFLVSLGMTKTGRYLRGIGWMGCD